MALRELQSRITIGTRLGFGSRFEILRKPTRILVEGDSIERPMEGLVDSLTSGTYPSIRVEVGQGDRVDVVWREAAGRWNREYSLEGDQIKHDPVVKKVVRQR